MSLSLDCINLKLRYRIKLRNKNLQHSFSLVKGLEKRKFQGPDLKCQLFIKSGE